MSSNICGMLLHAWALAAGDPAAQVALWLRDGAPAGIRVPLDELEGIMPKVTNKDGEETDCPDLLSTEYDTFVNHGSLEDDAEVMGTFDDLAGKNYLHRCSSLAVLMWTIAHPQQVCMPGEAKMAACGAEVESEAQNHHGL